jgi:hypothetical protein
MAIAEIPSDGSVISSELLVERQRENIVPVVPLQPSGDSAEQQAPPPIVNLKPPNSVPEAPSDQVSPETPTGDGEAENSGGESPMGVEWDKAGFIGLAGPQGSPAPAVAVVETVAAAQTDFSQAAIHLDQGKVLDLLG